MEKLNLQGHKADNLSFREIYDSMDRRAFVRRIATVTKRSEAAVYNWISGDRKSTRQNSSHGVQSRMPSSA